MSDKICNCTPNKLCCDGLGEKCSGGGKKKFSVDFVIDALDKADQCMCGKLVGGSCPVHRTYTAQQYATLTTALAAEKEKAVELQATLDLIQTAYERGTKAWQEATGKTMATPDTGDLVRFLLEKVEGVTEKLRRMKSSRNWNRVANRANRKGRAESDAYLVEAEQAIAEAAKNGN